MKTNNILILTSLFTLLACQKEEIVNIDIYKNGKISNTFSGSFYTTKYGGLNYYIRDNNERVKLFKIKDIDSISFSVNNRKYISKPLIDKPFSREINISDFSFFIDEKHHKIIADTIEDMSTMALFSAKTNMEKLKENGTIKTIYLESVK